MSREFAVSIVLYAKCSQVVLHWLNVCVCVCVSSTMCSEDRDIISIDIISQPAISIIKITYICGI